MYRQLEKNLLNSNTSSTYPDNMVNFGLLTAEICWRVWGTPADFNGFRVLAALLHGTLVVGISQTLRRWTQGATYIWQGGHHIGHWPTFLVFFLLWHWTADTRWEVCRWKKLESIEWFPWLMLGMTSGYTKITCQYSGKMKRATDVTRFIRKVC